MIRSLVAVLMVVLSFNANSALIESDLTEDNFITYDELDWAWASSISTQDYYGNRLYSPEELRPGWRYASEDELEILKNEITLDMFAIRDVNGQIIGYKQAIAYWNSILEYSVYGDNHIGIDIEDFEADKVTSNGATDPDAEWDYETFYVRDTNTANVQVTEPGTLFLLALSLIGISLRARRS